MTAPDTAEQWPRLADLFSKVAELPQDARERFIEAQCGQDSTLRRRLEELLAADAAADTTWTGLELEASSPSVPTIPGYDDVELVGHGGMGSVYRARRRDRVFDGKWFAIKVLHAHRLSEAGRRRFAMERRLLATLDHPNIVGLRDGGELEDGRPFFVMDHVEGEPLDVYCRRHRVSIDDRLRLFRVLCDTLHHAHQHLVVHRDLKPANIRVDADGTPHLLDFGIAKWLDDTATATASQLVPMTPRYASPEQAAGRPVTTASDIYSAGVVLHELLTGRLPSPGSNPIESDPPLLSAAIPDAEIATERGISPSRLRRRLRGDLDHIVAKSLRWNPDERYASARELADDIDRHLGHLPVMARRGSWRLRVRRFARRHRLGLAVAAMAMLAAILATVAAIQSWRLAVTAGETRTMLRELADAGEELLIAEGDLDALVDRAVEADLPVESRTLLLSMLKRLNVPKEQQLGLVVELFQAQASAGADDSDLAELAFGFGDMFFQAHELRAAEQVFAASARFAEAAHGPEAIHLVPHLEHRARVLGELEQFDEAHAVWRRSIRIRSREPIDRHGLALAHSHLSNLFYLQHHHEAAATEARRALAIIDGDDTVAPSFRASLLTGLAVTLVDFDAAASGDEALACAREAVEIATAIYPSGHLEVLKCRNNLAAVLARIGRVSEAVVLTEETLTLAEAALGSDHPRLAYLLTGLADAYSRLERPERCVAAARRAVELRQQSLPAVSALTAKSQIGLAICSAELGQVDEAVDLLQKSVWALEQSPVDTTPLLERARVELTRWVASPPNSRRRGVSRAPIADVDR
ncbi:MAG: serine/threonine-protein kinase [Acidobacteriota bacterium]